ncbi:MAG: ATP-binding protein [Sandaracinaceae bacterium]
MSSDGDNGGGQALREHALARLRGRREVLPTELGSEQLIEELRVHQIELELQNEELRRTQGELAKSHEAYLELFELAPLPFLALGLGFRVRKANQAALQLLGEGLAKTTALSLVTKEHRGELASWLRQLGSKVEQRDVDFYRADGSVGTGLVRGRLLPDSILLCLEDVSEARRVQAALAASERDLRRLADLAPDAVCVCHSGVLVYVNRAFEDLVGATRAQVVGSRFASFAHAEDRRRVEGFLGNPGHAGARPPVRLSTPNGGDRVVEVRTMQFVFAGDTAELIIARDLTERRRLEARMEQSERLATVGMLVAGVAHEINNPMAFTVANLEVLVQGLGGERDVEREELAEAARDALSGVRRVARIVSDLRAFQRVEDHMAEVKPNRAVMQALRLAESEVAHRAQIRRDLGAVRPVLANENRLVQVLLNLIVNAGQAMAGRRSEDSWVRVRTWDDSDVCIAVEDNGPGISPDQIGRIFDPFYTTRRSEGGTGLGLAICNSLVQHMGGFIEVDSTPSGGARFVVRLPAMDRAPSTGLSTAPPPEAPVLPEALRLLVIDDERAVVRSIRRLLLGTADIAAAYSGRDAIATLTADGRFDAVLCDLVMTDGTGEDVAHWLRDHRPDLARRLIIMTGMPHPDAPPAMGAVVLHKPFTRRSLERTLASVVANAGMDDEPAS